MLIAVYAVSCSAGTNDKNTIPTQATVSATAEAPDGGSTAPASVTSDSDGSGQKIWTETELLISTGLRFAIRESSQDDYDAYNALANDAALHAREKLLDLGIITPYNATSYSLQYNRGHRFWDDYYMNEYVLQIMSELPEEDVFASPIFYYILRFHDMFSDNEKEVPLEIYDVVVRLRGILEGNNSDTLSFDDKEVEQDCSTLRSYFITAEHSGGFRRNEGASIPDSLVCLVVRADDSQLSITNNNTQETYEHSATKLDEQRDVLVNALMETTDGEITFTDDPEQCSIVLRYKVTFSYSGEYGQYDKVRGYGHKYNIQVFNKSTGEFIAETTVSNSAGSTIPAVSSSIYVHRFPILQNYDEFAAFVEFLLRDGK